MKSICTERVWEFPWEQEYEEYLESQEDNEDDEYEYGEVALSERCSKENKNETELLRLAESYSSLE